MHKRNLNKFLLNSLSFMSSLSLLNINLVILFYLPFHLFTQYLNAVAPIARAVAMPATNQKPFDVYLACSCFTYTFFANLYFPSSYYLSFKISFVRSSEIILTLSNLSSCWEALDLSSNISFVWSAYSFIVGIGRHYSSVRYCTKSSLNSIQYQLYRVLP